MRHRAPVIARILCALWGHDRLAVIARITSTDGTPYAYLDLGCSRCHR